MSNVVREIDTNGVAILTLNRPERHNAFDDRLLSDLGSALQEFKKSTAVRVVVIRAAGKSFSAGADLKWMQRMAQCSEQQNYEDALGLARFFATLATLDKPTVALVQGATFGGGVGLVAACDIAIASDKARFALSEVKLGLIPAVISPYVSRAIGGRNCQYYGLTGERFDADQALHLGLVQRVVPHGQLDSAGRDICNRLLKNGPAAMAAVKKRLADYSSMDLEAIAKDTAGTLARIRVSAEGREGVAAFLEKRQPLWVKTNV